jgi:ribose-phosphate pyrophosphokinase
MIKLRHLSPSQELENIDFQLSLFPDSTSQVWQIKFPTNAPSNRFQILWLFENEGELFQVLQLAKLIKSEFKSDVTLEIPYLPYARQDKQISNQSTWAIHLFAEILNQNGILDVTTFDQHSPLYFKSRSPQDFHRSIINHDILCFPDKGATKRYPHLAEYPVLHCEKVRDQQSGVIEKLSLGPTSLDLRDKRILIVDDLCDGGGTFIQVAQVLQPLGPKQIDLCVSHGLFTKGRDVLHAAGIKNIFTTNSLLRNTNGFSVWK